MTMDLRCLMTASRRMKDKQQTYHNVRTVPCLLRRRPHDRRCSETISGLFGNQLITGPALIQRRGDRRANTSFTIICYTDAPGLDGLKFGVLNQRKTSCNDGLYSWDKVFLRNNIYRGTARALYSSDSAESHVDMDYDNLYTIGTGNIITWAGANYQTIQLCFRKERRTTAFTATQGSSMRKQRLHPRPDSINV
jgi:hypothetical protein